MSAPQKEPPLLEETVTTPPLLSAFSYRLESQYCAENALFLSAATFVSRLKIPPENIDVYLRRIIWLYVVQGMPAQVNLPASITDSILPALFLPPDAKVPDTERGRDKGGHSSGRGDKVRALNTDMFSRAISEVHTLLQPMFDAWVVQREWECVGTFSLLRTRQLPPFNIVLRTPALYAGFQHFLEHSDGKNKDGSFLLTDSLAFCLDADKLRRTTRDLYTSDDSGDSKGKKDSKKHGKSQKGGARRRSQTLVDALDLDGPIDSCPKPISEVKRDKSVAVLRSSATSCLSSQGGDMSGTSSDGSAAGGKEKERPSESEARQLLESYKDKVSFTPRKGGPDESGETWRDYMCRELDTVTAKFINGDVFPEYIKSKAWGGVEVARKKYTLQTRCENGKYLELPSLAAALSADGKDGLLHLVKYLVRGTSRGHHLAFLLRVLEFRTLCEQQIVNKKERNAKAKQIYKTFIDKKSVQELLLSNEIESAGNTSLFSQADILASPALGPKAFSAGYGEGSTVTMSPPSSDSGSRNGSRAPSASASPASRLLSSSALLSTNAADWLVATEKKTLQELGVATLPSKLDSESFRKIGAYVFRSIEQTWFREILSNISWVDRDYDNDSLATQRIESYFCDPTLEVPCSAPVEPYPDDIILNHETLLPTFIDSLPPEVKTVFGPFINAVASVQASHTKIVTKEKAETIRKMMKDLLSEVPELEPIINVCETYAGTMSEMNARIFEMGLELALRELCARGLYTKWIKQNSDAWKDSCLKWIKAPVVFFHKLPGFYHHDCVCLYGKVDDDFNDGFNDYSLLLPTSDQSADVTVLPSTRPRRGPHLFVRGKKQQAQESPSGPQATSPMLASSSPLHSAHPDVVVPQQELTSSPAGDESQLRQYRYAPSSSSSVSSFSSECESSVSASGQQQGGTSALSSYAGDDSSSKASKRLSGFERKDWVHATPIDKKHSYVSMTEHSRRKKEPFEPLLLDKSEDSSHSNVAVGQCMKSPYSLEGSDSNSPTCDGPPKFSLDDPHESHSRNPLERSQSLSSFQAKKSLHGTKEKKSKALSKPKGASMKKAPSLMEVIITPSFRRMFDSAVFGSFRKQLTGSLKSDSGSTSSCDSDDLVSTVMSQNGELWKRLTLFHDKYSFLDDFELALRQKEIKADALDILSEYGTRLPNAEKLKKAVDKGMFLTPNFFLSDEVQVFTISYQKYFLPSFASDKTLVITPLSPLSGTGGSPDQKTPK